MALFLFIAINIIIIHIKSLKNKNDFINLFKILKKYGYNRILIESGLIFLNELLKNRLINNLYIFQSPIKLGRKGKNNSSNKTIMQQALQLLKFLQIFFGHQTR